MASIAFITQGCSAEDFWLNQVPALQMPKSADRAEKLGSKQKFKFSKILALTLVSVKALVCPKSEITSFL
jgi:hypothetical protein